MQPRARVQEAPTALAKRREYSSGQPWSRPVRNPAAKASPAPDSSIDSTSNLPARNASFPCRATRSEEHTSELQSLAYLVCRLLLEKKKKLIRQCVYYCA